MNFRTCSGSLGLTNLRWNGITASILSTGFVNIPAPSFVVATITTVLGAQGMAASSLSFGLTSGTIPAWAQPGAGVAINVTVAGVPILIGGVIKDVSGTTGSNIVTGSPSYSPSGYYTLTGLTVGTVYLWTPGAGDAGVVNGAQTLAAANGAQIFVAAATSVTLTGVSSGNINATVNQAAVLTISPSSTDAKNITKTYNNQALDAVAGSVVNTVTLNMICQKVAFFLPSTATQNVTIAMVADATGANPLFQQTLTPGGPEYVLEAPLGAKFDIADLFAKASTSTQTLTMRFL